MTSIREKAIHTVNVPAEYKFERDPKDKPYINLALAANVDYIVTRDADMLDLMDERRRDGKEFRHRYPLLKIVDPVIFLQILAAQKRQ